jgi:hypothetical protein
MKQAPVRPPITELDARKAKAPPPFKISAPKGAPNVGTILDRHLSFLLTPEPLHSAAVPQHHRETGGLATDPF